MANKQFSFAGLKRTFMTVEMPDGKKIVLAMPKKKTFEALKDFNPEQLRQMGSGEAMAVLTRMASDFLSNNLTGEEFSVDYVAENFDIEQLMGFIDAYMDFVIQGKNDPN